MFLTDARIARGVDFWRQHEAVLARAEQEYGVPAQVIVSIIGIETFYGRNTGSYRVIDALSLMSASGSPLRGTPGPRWIRSLNFPFTQSGRAGVTR